MRKSRRLLRMARNLPRTAGNGLRMTRSELRMGRNGLRMKRNELRMACNGLRMTGARLPVRRNGLPTSGASLPNLPRSPIARLPSAPTNSARSAEPVGDTWHLAYFGGSVPDLSSVLLGCAFV